MLCMCTFCFEMYVANQKQYFHLPLEVVTKMHLFSKQANVTHAE